MPTNTFLEIRSTLPSSRGSKVMAERESDDDTEYPDDGYGALANDEPESDEEGPEEESQSAVNEVTSPQFFPPPPAPSTASVDRMLFRMNIDYERTVSAESDPFAAPPRPPPSEGENPEHVAQQLAARKLGVQG